MSGRPLKRVLQLVSRDEPGGVQVLTDMIGAGLKARGIEVETLALISKGTRRERLSHLRLVAIRIFRGRYDAIFSYHAAAGLLMATVGRIAGITRRLSHLTAMPEAIRGRWRLLDKIAGLTGGYTAVIANSAATAQAFADFPAAYTKRIHTIPHGVVPLPPALGQMDWRRQLGMAASSKILVAAGRLTEQKNYETVVRALAELPGIHLAVAGDGPLRHDLETLANRLGVTDRLHLPGMIDRASLGDFLAMGTIYLSPSNWETFGLAAVEAQMAGLPVIASDLPVLREVLGAAGGPKNLAFHPVGDTTALAATISAMLADYPDQAALEATAKAAEGHYGIGVMIDRYLDFCAK